MQVHIVNDVKKNLKEKKKTSHGAARRDRENGSGVFLFWSFSNRSVYRSISEEKIRGEGGGEIQIGAFLYFLNYL